MTNKTSKHSDTAKGQKIRFFFPGGGEYEPMSVEAADIEEAKKIWEKKRKKVDNTSDNLEVKNN